MIIKGSVEDIIYRNEENGYTVINFDADGQLITAVGVFPTIGEGETLALTGENKFNPKFGEQFVVTDIEFLQPDDTESIRKYLASGLFYGVGETTAAALVSHFGKYTLEIIENYPERLTEAVGIGKKKASDIVAGYSETKKMKDSLLFLNKCGFSMAMSLKIYKNYQDLTVEMIKENPYRLIHDIEGVGFLTADKVGGKLGIAFDSDFRLMAGIIYTLQEAAGKSGHTYLPREMLIEETARLVGFDDLEHLDSLLEAMPFQIKLTRLENETAVSLIPNYNAENSIAARLINLNSAGSTLDIDIEKELDVYEKTHAIELHGNQREAIKCAIGSGVTIITGGPGTGKTTIIKCLTTVFSQRGLKVALTAPTGRASKRMSEATGEEAKTLHRLLNITGRELPTDISPLDFDAVIVDEISMADIYIFNTLLKAIPLGARLILVGDKDQLPSVSCGNILADTLSSGLFSTVYLTEIYRQSKESMIITNAHRINRGEMPVTKKGSDFFIDPKSKSEDILESVLSMVETRIPKYMSLSSQDIQVLAPMKKGLAGVENLNRELQKRLNPNGREIKHGETIFREGDKVMQTANNYLMEWERKNGFYFESGTGVFNGDIGFIIQIKDGVLAVEFEDGKVCKYKGSELDELMLAYCISVHKSQGCEFPVSLIVVSGGSYAILTKNLLYTAVTRAKNLAVIIGSEDNIYRMVSNNYIAKRYSLLRHLITQNKEKHEKLWSFNK